MSCSVRDGIELELRGTPTVAIHTAVFSTSAVAHADAFGMPDFESAIIRHPIAGIEREEITARAEEVAPIIVRLLTSRESK